MVHWTKERPKLIPVTFPKRRLSVEKEFGFDLPLDRGGYIAAGAEWEECPNCHRCTAVKEIHWIGGQGRIPHLVCDRCGYWERKA